MKGGWLSQWEPPFYGLTLKPEDRLRIHTDIHQLCYHGGGGFTPGELYEMPIFLRYFHLKQLSKTKEAEAESARNASRGGEDVEATPKSAPKKIQPKPF